MVNLGDRLRDLRRCMHLTQQQVAERIGVSKSMISSYELGSRQPSYEMLIKLATLYDVTTDYLLGRTTTKVIDVTNLTDQQFRLLQQLAEEFERR